jgi:signal transduction histidine kinase
MAMDTKTSHAITMVDLPEQGDFMQSLLHDKLLVTETLIASVSHEINNPIAWILSNLNYIKKQLDTLNAGERQTIPDLSNLEAAVIESIQGIERIRDIARMLKHVGPTYEQNDEPIDIHDVLNTVIDMVSFECKFRARVKKMFGSNVPLIVANSGQLYQVFLNLMLNAIQAMPEGDVEHNELTIITSVESMMLRVDIKDTGAGIHVDDLPHIFAPFFSTKPIGVGSGLGLAICNKIIRDFGGEIRVKSEVGKGSTFSVFIPLHHSE